MRTPSIILGLTLISLSACKGGDPVDEDGDGFDETVDCNDDDETIHPDADEICDGVDNNCDGVADGADASDAVVWYGDADGDGYGGTLTITQCEAPTGFVEDAGSDCNDSDASINPDGVEVCDDVDNDCDGLIDDDDDSVDASTAGTYYVDGDSDGFGDGASTPVQACGTPDGYAETGDDCDDTNAELNPETVWHTDFDQDGYGSTSFTQTVCEQPDGYILDGQDCDDTNAAVNPDGLEVCDELDNDCDGLTDDADDSVDTATFSEWYTDGDSDGYGDDNASPTLACAGPSGTVAVSGDCDDAETAVNPDAEEVCEDGLDNDCSGDAPECGLTGVLSVTDADITITGGTTSTYFGRKYAMPDLNGDGVDDFVGGAYGYDGDYTNTGQLYITYGGISGVTSDTTTNITDATLDGSVQYAYIGYDMADLGDVDGDGYDDLLVGSYYHSGDDGSYQGSAWLLYGSATAMTDDYIDAYGVEFTGENASDYMGQGVEAMGDINDDGFADFGIGSYSNDDYTTNAGKIYLYYGDSAQETGGSGADADALITSADYYAYLGFFDTFGAGGDLDGDGIGDAVIGEYYGGNSYYGGVSVVYGSTTELSGNMTIEDIEDASFTGAATYDYFGKAYATGDVTGDGYDDLIVGEYSGDNSSGNGSGMVYVFEGSASGYTGTYTTADAFVTLEGLAAYDGFGNTVAVGDVNGDGTMDLAVGASGTDIGSYYSNGSVYVFNGPLSDDATAADASADIAGDSSASYQYLGYFGLGFYDVDGDGADDLMAGAYGAGSYAGKQYVFFGGSM